MDICNGEYRRYISFQMAEVMMEKRLFTVILSITGRVRSYYVYFIIGGLIQWIRVSQM